MSIGEIEICFFAKSKRKEREKIDINLKYHKMRETIAGGQSFPGKGNCNRRRDVLTCKLTGKCLPGDRQAGEK